MGEVTHEVLAERIEQLREDNRKFENEMQGYVQLVVFDAFKSALDQRIQPLEAFLKWLIALVGTMIVTAVIGSVLVTSAAG